MNPKDVVEEVGEDIVIPRTSGGDGAADDEALIKMQEALFTKKTSAPKDGVGDESEPEPKSKSEPKSKKGKDRAEELLRKSAEQSAKVKEEVEFEAKTPAGFVDLATIFGGEPEKEKPTENSEPETEVDLNKETNIKNLRTVAGNFKRERDEIKVELETLRETLKTKPEVSALQRELDSLRGRVKELEPYELVFALHQNPEFKQRFVDGANNLVGEMKQIAGDYGVGEDVVQDILLTTNRKDLDDILEESFSSSAARSDIKTLKQKYDGLQRERAEYEKKPQESLTKFQEHEARASAQRAQQRDTYLKQAINSGWQSALKQNEELPENERIYELMEIPGKREHNEKVVKPTLNAAQNLVEMGLRHIETMVRNQGVPDPKFVSWFASVCQQAVATQMLNYSRAGLYQKYLELRNEVQKRDSLDRPSINGASKSSGGDRKLNGNEIAARIFLDVQKETSG